MLIEVLLFLILGIIIGTVTGLIPGLHPNTIFVFALSLMPLLSQFPLECVITFVISLSVSNVFLDFIPSMFFGAPEPTTVMSVLPAHSFLLTGNGYEALFLTVLGGFTVGIMIFITSPAVLLLVPAIYLSIRPYMQFIMVAVVSWMILIERGLREKVCALSIFLLSGLFGLITLNTMSDSVMFPALTGLFGFSQLVLSVSSNAQIPKQELREDISANPLRGGITGWLAGMFAGLLPGIGSSQAAVMASQILRAKKRDFMIALGGINTSNIMFTFLAFYAIGKTRSGAAWFISQITEDVTQNMLVLVLVIGLVSCFISSVIALKVGRYLILRLNKIDYSRLNMFIIIFLIASVAVFTGPVGLFISLVGTLIGILAVLSGIKRSHLMGFLIFPTILYFSGTLPHISLLFGI